MQNPLEAAQVIVILSGNIYVGQAAKLLESMLKHLESGIRHFEFDITAATDIDSFGLAVLAMITKKASERGGSVIVKGVNDSMQQMLALIPPGVGFEMTS